jgi:hypothetical protein
LATTPFPPEARAEAEVPAPFPAAAAEPPPLEVAVRLRAVVFFEGAVVRLLGAFAMVCSSGRGESDASDDCIGRYAQSL